MRKRMILLVSVLMILLQAHSQTTDPGFLLRLKSGDRETYPNATEYLSGYTAGTEKFYQSKLYKIVQFYSIPGETEKNLLRQAGLELLDYLPDKAWFASISEGFDPQSLLNRNIRSIVDIHPGYKLSQSLSDKNYPSDALDGRGNIRLVVATWSNLDPSQTEASLRASGVNITGRDDFGKVFYTLTPLAAIPDLASLPFVMYVEPGYPVPEPENYTGRTLHHTNVVASDYDAGRHYTGDGVDVMLQDDGIIGPHVDYAGRIGAQYLSNNDGDHGDHCAGIIFGAGNVDPAAKGNAFGADLYVYSVSPSYPGFSAIPTVYGSLGIRVTSASYGDGCNSGYTSLTRTLDQQVRLYPALLHVFSAGNSGSSDCGYGAGAGWGNITGGHKIGKNVIAVANLDFQDNLASSSSRGPSTDGRIKPDLGAKGTSVYSTINPNTYDYKSGTSMACPGTAGTLAQLIEAYRDLNSGKDPMAGLLKAIMLNTAEDLGNPGPDFKFGWGRINAKRAVEVIEDQRFDSGTIVQGGNATLVVPVPPNTAQLRVMVYWTDFEAVPNASVALVNNLNITLTDPAGTPWNPWVLSHFPHPDSLNKAAVRGIDNRNNMEQVSLDNPPPGNYSLSIQGINIPQGPQTWYAVYEFIPMDVFLTYPIGGESLVPGETEVVRWDASTSGEPFTLLFSSDNGQTWDTVSADIPSASRTYNWVVPAQATPTGLIRVIRGGSQSQSAAPFSILGVPCSLKIDWACSQSLRLSWNPVMGAIGYEVMKLGERYMESAGMTDQTSYILEDSQAGDVLWLTVRALGQDSVRGRRALAVTKAATTFNCFPSDAMILSAPTAEWGVFQNNLPLSDVGVPIIIRNFGHEDITNPVVHYRLNQGPVRTETVTGTIEPDSTLYHLFSEKIDISSVGEYLLTTWIDYPGDLNPANDTLKVPFEVIDGTLLSSGSVQTFDSWTKCSGASACEALNCALADGWLNLENNLYDRHDWRTYSGSTSSQGTGPDFDHTTGTTSGKYLYIEPTVACLNKQATLEPPTVDLSGLIKPVLKLWYHAWGADIGSFHIDLFDGTEVVQDIIKPVEGSHGNKWNELEADLSPWTGKVVGLRFRGMTACKDKGDFAIDDICVCEDIPFGAGSNGNSQSRLSVYPNPAKGNVYISVPDHSGTQACDLFVKDLFGRVIYHKAVIPAGGSLQEMIDLSGFPSGIYLLELRSDLVSYTSKLIVR